MKVSLSWLQAYVPVNMEIGPLAEALTMAGLEVESVSDRYAFLESVRVARVLSVATVPGSGHLKQCRLDAGDRQVAVVCGAPNVREGMLSPLALPGTILPNGIEIGKTLIRGVASEGMLCSQAELALGTDAGGIMELSSELPLGLDLGKAMALSDPVLEIGLTPNRADCLSIIGIAREVAAILKTSVQYPESRIHDRSDEIRQMTSITIDAPELCPRYAARLLTGVSVGPSPFWLQDRLMSVGMRPINNLVDVTNFVMMETGQPLHAFDFDHLAGNRIVVRTAREGEVFTTLDGKKRSLGADMLMICDGEKPVGIAGVMGGENSEIDGETRRVLIESAYFLPIGVRRTSKKLGLGTEASHRFERGVDPEGTVKALDRAALLMAQVAGGKIADGFIDENPRPHAPKRIFLPVAHVNRLLGTDLERDPIRRLLESVEFAVTENGGDGLAVGVPSYRVDVTRPEDLIEEVARLMGYNRIPTTFPPLPGEARKPARQLLLRNRIRNLLTGFGFTEIITYSFIHPSACDRLELDSEDRRRNLLRVLNPISEDQAVMRTSLVPGLLDTMRRNLSQQIRNFRIFEVGKTFLSRGQDTLPEEIEMLSGLWTGTRYDAPWHSRSIGADFYDIKGAVEGLLTGLKVEDPVFSAPEGRQSPYIRPGHTAEIRVGEESIGLVGEAHPRVLENFDLKQTAFVFEIDLDRLYRLLPETRQARPLPRYPAAFRDLTVIVSRQVESARLLSSIRQMNPTWVEEAFLFDVFEGDPIPAGKKSISIRIVYRSSSETLEDEGINRVQRDISHRLLQEFDAALPG